jgi:hypothetical protein
MAYLNSPRLTFSGKFQADPSTVNNDVNHYNNATFQPSYQEYGEGGTNGWWNPDGTGNWRLIDCVITSVTYMDGTTTSDPGKDPIIGMSIMDANSRVAGKIVDLDPQQQSVSQIWGMIVRIGQGETDFVKGNFEPIAFNDIWWNRSTTQKGSSGASASYQSVVTDLQWSEVESKSRYLEELRRESPERLSMKFNVDIFNQQHDSAHFTIGRIVGSIGPSRMDEPKHFIMGRQFVSDLTCNSGMYMPLSTSVYVANGLLQEETKQFILDLGNFLQTAGPEGAIAESRTLVLAANIGGEAYVLLGELNFKLPKWYENRGGLVKIRLTDEQVDMVRNCPLAIMNQQSDGSLSPLVKELTHYVRADQFVFRMNSGEESNIDFYATYLGKPMVNQAIVCQFQDSLINIMGQGDGTPATSTPNILAFEPGVVTDTNGKATLTVKASNPQNPRGFIDGQVYALWYYLEGYPTVDFTFTIKDGNPVVLPAALSGIDPTNFISILVFDSVKPEVIAKPDWDKDVQPVMQQYANLYPLMSKGIFNLANREVVDNNAKLLRFVFDLPREDPNHMPVTRDLSRDKKQMILNYLDRAIKENALADLSTAERIIQST